jgi:hypothetical protein
LKKKLIIISLNPVFKKFFFLKKLENRFQIYNFVYSNNYFNFKKLVSVTSKYKENVIILDLLPNIDFKIKNKKYLLNIINFYKFRKFFKDKNFYTIRLIDTQISNLDICDFFLINFLRKILLNIKNLFFYNKYRFVDPNAVILTGNKSNLIIPFSNCKKIYWHTNDYQKFLDLKLKPRLDKYAVYLDQHFDENHDKILTGNPTNKLGNLYKELRKFFFNTENYFNLKKIIIAKHPKRTSNILEENFTKSAIKENKTAELVANSSLVLAHCSLSISFAILYKKPIIFLTSKELENTIYHKRILLFAKFFRIPPINISEKNENLKDFLSTNVNYNKYIDNYLKHSCSKVTQFSNMLIK